MTPELASRIRAAETLADDLHATLRDIDNAVDSMRRADVDAFHDGHDDVPDHIRRARNRVEEAQYELTRAVKQIILCETRAAREWREAMTMGVA